jgi:hypothetical protein
MKCHPPNGDAGSQRENNDEGRFVNGGLMEADGEDMTAMEGWSLAFYG